jgi:hypothetical protein
MNLLRIQDALKNASDQQLMALMQAPDSTAPSYLVLSEIRRRKDMRAKQAPQEGSNRTVAEDLTASQEPVGIQGLQGQDSIDPDGVDAADGGVQGMAAGGLASLRRYREGGIVRMQAGGNIDTMSADELRQLLGQMSDPRFRPPGVTATPDQIRNRLADLEQRQEDVFLQAPRSRLRQDLGAVGQAVHGAVGSGGELISGAGRLAADVGRAATEYALTPVEPRSPFPGGRLPEPEPVRGQFLAEERIPDRDEVRGPDFASLGSAPRPGSQGQTRPGGTTTQATTTQGGGQPRPAGGGGGGGGAPAGAGGTEAGLPTMADIYRQNQGLFADGIAALRERAQQERVDPAARRSEAVNMALIEAGLRIAGSRNPSLVGAIGEGALPAVQSYGQQLGQIRAEQREARRDELELAKQELNRQFAVGQISATEYRTRMDNITRTNIADRQERMAGARAAEADARADRRVEAQARLQADELRRRGFYTPEEFAALPEPQRAIVRELRSIGRPLDTSGINTVLNATVAEIGRIRTEMDGDPAPRPTSSGYAEWQRRDADRRERLRVAEERRRTFEDDLRFGRQQSGQTGAGGQTRNWDPATNSLR